MRVYGLTGGIASGKSTVAAMFRSLGAPVVDADVLARRAVEPGEPALAEIAAWLGPAALAADGTLDRRAVGERVFADPAARARLESITHPRIAALGQAELAELAAAGHAVAIYEAPLLVERGLHRALAGLAVVTIGDELQRERLIARDRLEPAAAAARIAAQLPLAAKLAAATWVIDNGGALDRTRDQVEAVWRAMRVGPPHPAAARDAG